MTTKAAIISTLAILAGAIILGLIVLTFAQLSSRNAEMLGQGLGMLTLLPLGGIWIMWADRFRKEREKRNKGR